MLGDVFYWVFNMSITATICMVPILLIRLIKKMPRRIFAWLWIVPFIRMCNPIGFSSRYSIISFLSQFTTKTGIAVDIFDQLSLSMMNYSMGAYSYFPIVYKTDSLGTLFRGASVVWIVVALAAILTLGIIYFVTLRELRDAQKLKDNVYCSDKIQTPAVYGILTPKIIIPARYNEYELQYILMHEQAHIKRKDNFVRLFAFIIVCIHWFNPFSWLMLKLLYSDIELSCDEIVLSKCNEKERKEYAHTLLTAVEKTSIFTVSFGGANLRTRIENILSYNKISILATIVFTTLIIVICYILITNAV